jgi:hypothetical protein
MRHSTRSNEIVREIRRAGISPLTIAGEVGIQIFLAAEDTEEDKEKSARCLLENCHFSVTSMADALPPSATIIC